MENIAQNYSPNSTVPFRDGWPCYEEHSLLESAANEAARELQVSREMAMMCAFGAISTACQSIVDVQMPTGHKVPTSLMLLTIADSGERKTTTQNYFFEAIYALNNKAYRYNEEAQEKHKEQHQIWTTEKKFLERKYNKMAALKDTTATEVTLKEIENHIRKEPTLPECGKFLYDDTTPQALVQMLNENLPNGCLLTSEANSILSGKALGELDKLNTLWDGGSVIVDRISRESFILEDARLTLSLMAQPIVITRFMGKRGEEARGTGFLARLLVAKPSAMAGYRTPNKLSSLPRKKEFNNRTRELTTKQSITPRQVLIFSERASDIWLEYSKTLEAEMRENKIYHYLKDHASKLLENTTRLAALLHTFEREADSDIEISSSTLEFCWAFARTCSSHFIKNLASEPQLVTDANNLAHYLLREAYKEQEKYQESARKNGKSLSRSRENLPGNLIIGARTTFTLTNIKQNGPGSLRGRANSERLDAAIELLTRLGHIKKEGGRYKFKETVIRRRIDPIEPEMKNGEFISIKELPLFTEQEYHAPTGGIWSEPEYYIKTK
ncbi:MAG TPA: hypothetical protein DIU04_17835 [Pseudomonas sp.]|uniref:YfjI family protein n=2 Tax=unclassified Pseudomonas TaxID=196821 RepID=UPI000EE81DC9|nr:YfjI family protein [Pseudomonas sp.]HCP56581.1 hypothetical protein [Pseudomonas sp.]|tara:strand:+ start:824 stop:2491 length:1668 start_codon:yes stop_codon:yes gene_type:complete